MGYRKRMKYLPPHGFICPCGRCEIPPIETCEFCGEYPTQVWDEAMEELYRVERPEEYAEQQQALNTPP